MNEHAFFPVEGDSATGSDAHEGIQDALDSLFGDSITVLSTPPEGPFPFTVDDASDTEVPAEVHDGAIDAPYWADRTDLAGMGLAVQRVKRIASDLAGGVVFEDVFVETVYDGPEEDPACTLVLLTVRPPEDVDAVGFASNLYAAVADELIPEDLERLALRVE